MKNKITLLFKKLKDKNSKSRADESLYVVCRHSSFAISRANEGQTGTDSHEKLQMQAEGDKIEKMQKALLTKVKYQRIELDLFFQKKLHQIVLNIYLEPQTLAILPETNVQAKNINTKGGVLQNKIWLRKYEHKKFNLKTPSMTDGVKHEINIEEQISAYAFEQVVKSIGQGQRDILKKIILQSIDETRAEICTLNFLNHYKSIALVHKKENFSYKKNQLYNKIKR